MSQRLRIQLLGGLQAQRGGQVFSHFSTRQTASLLAFLAYYPRAHSRSTLIEMLWPERDAAAGRNSLSVALSTLRRLLGGAGDAVLHADRLSVGLDPASVTTDVREFEAALQSARTVRHPEDQAHWLDQAVQLYTGPLLPGFYESWIIPQEQRLETEFLRALMQLIDLCRNAGDYDLALHYVHHGLQLLPLQEELHQEAMRLHMQVADAPAALRQHHALVRLLDAEGLTPSPTSRQLLREIETQLEPRDATPVWPGAPRQVVPAPHERPFAPSWHAGNLPLQFTRFHGREQELTRLQELLANSATRLVTLTGAGGSGKTRLAIESAARLRQSSLWPGGIWFIPLDAVTDGGLLGTTVLDVLRLQPGPGAAGAGGRPPASRQDPVEQIIAALADRPALLVLDNLEQLGSSSASFVRTLLRRLPQLTCLATSRQRLRVSGETECVVGALPVPKTSVTSVADLMDFSSVRLFVDRAQAARPGFELTARNAGTIAELCRRLEGMPLALELAAARSAVLGPPQLLTQLSAATAQLDLSRDDPARLQSRQRTLRATVEWTYRLLSSGLRSYLARIGVFAGSWTVEAAAAICDEPGALDYTAQLRDWSLVTAEEAGRQMRFQMLNTIRAFAREQLPPDAHQALQRRHAEFYLALAERAAPAAPGPEPADAWRDLDDERPNLRAALEWSLAHEPELGLRLVGALQQFWDVRGHFHEARRWLHRALEGNADTPHLRHLRARLLAAAGKMARLQGDFTSARPLFEQSLELCRALSDDRATAFTLDHLGAIAMHSGNFDEARKLITESVALMRATGVPGDIAAVVNSLGVVAMHQADFAAAQSLFEESATVFRESCSKWYLSFTLTCLGNTARYQGNFELARKSLEEALALNEDIGNEGGTAWVLHHQGWVEFAAEHYAAAAALFARSLELWHKVGNQLGIVHCLEGAAAVLAASGRPRPAAQLLGAAAALRHVNRVPLSPCERLDYDCTLQSIQRRLDEAEMARAQTDGGSMSVSEAVTAALARLQGSV